jgi:hypothetical protein
MIVQMADPIVSHVSSIYCPHVTPHAMSACGEFLPIREGFEPPREPPAGKRLRQVHRWSRVFRMLEGGEKMFDLLDQRRVT